MHSWLLVVVPLFIVVVIIYDFVNTRRLIAIGVNLANIGQPFAATPPHAEKQILIVGDSSGVGVGSATPAGSIAGRIGNDFPNAQITNLSVSGSKTGELLSTLQNLSVNQNYDLMVIQIGGNDIVRVTQLDDLKHQLTEVLEIAKQHANQVVLLTCGNVGTSQLLPFGTRWYFTLRTKQVRRLFMAVTSEAGVHYVDLYRKRADDPWAHDPKKYYAPDMFHPSADGYGDWYSFVRPVIFSLPGFRSQL